MSAALKNAARAAARERRDAAHAAIGGEAASLIADHFMKTFSLAPRSCIAGYAAMGSEADPAVLLTRLDDAGYVCALPRIEERHAPLVFRRWRPGEALGPGLHGTREPFSSAAVCVPDLVLVPLLAFDGRGRRLGYGGGYYDRTLQVLRRENRKLLAVGVAFSAQEAQDLAEEEFDERLDWVVTEKGARSFGAAAGG
ncbi:5-formyltetrahydrofolate cyclo-ligase [Parvibaculum sp.]|mgnify:CR=1 FL=1|jgi:5-formyltetrahydrofolate cyclo-ligase|uniref:5-formyltetrahydrofolate cyclo-ligase n=1 Tax=Parvibaculum sp. TaxID=2024848 RepID=UPI001B05DD9A|nr:5-formyltetrahydrofolate cyclo-ligase [Parvibaculum sp.]MBO6667843.1 5-formyltetrahydrofolate cyclo-ligase [Parvibaculum sp.]MBO6690706.1 5-formyltetrahydrofolate cyclo-ligase [Parvibaculum sp.]MBO6714921.1 5-formyltetrahydrofolate cyclo-ligase [Parvibaculum sp.]|tara:strand:- start:682 stop:1272 length:591 start_codon:yes stop_codon:yes gene_type:complete